MLFIPSLTALLVSARLHGFNRTVREVVRVVRISESTIRKRLGDFQDTPSSQLTIDEFQKIDLEEEQDPPSFTQARKRAKQQMEELNKPEITSELEAFQKAVDMALGVHKKEDNVKITKENGPITSSENDNGVPGNGSSVFVPPFCTREQTNVPFSNGGNTNSSSVGDGKEDTSHTGMKYVL